MRKTSKQGVLSSRFMGPGRALHPAYAPTSSGNLDPAAGFNFNVLRLRRLVKRKAEAREIRGLFRTPRKGARVL